MPNKRKIAAAVIVAGTLRNEEIEPKRRKIWVRKWLEKRSSDGAHQTLLEEFRNEDGQKHLYKNFLRMNEENFKELLELVSPIIKKNDTNMRTAIPPSERLAVTLRFLATGDSYKSLSVLFRIASNTLTKIIPEVCDAIYQVLKDEYLKVCLIRKCIASCNHA